MVKKVKNLFANAGDVGSVVQEDSLEEEVVTHSSILSWKIPWIEEPGRPQSIVAQSIFLPIEK